METAGFFYTSGDLCYQTTRRYILEEIIFHSYARKNLIIRKGNFLFIYSADIWTIRTVGRKHLESFEMWCWRRMEKISWTDHVRHVEALLRVKEQRNILHEIRKRKANWIGHILRRNCLLQWVLKEI
jgi:hypothetical protein